MKSAILVCALTLLMGYCEKSIGQSQQVVAQLSGPALGVVDVALPEIKRMGLNLDLYRVVIYRSGGGYSVHLQPIDFGPDASGSGGKSAYVVIEVDAGRSKVLSVEQKK